MISFFYKRGCVCKRTKDKIKDEKGRKKLAVDITGEVADLFNKSNEQEGKMWNNYVTNTTIIVAPNKDSNCNRPYT